jgi:hypothetical protein
MLRESFELDYANKVLKVLIGKVLAPFSWTETSTTSYSLEWR